MISPWLNSQTYIGDSEIIFNLPGGTDRLQSPPWKNVSVSLSVHPSVHPSDGPSVWNTKTQRFLTQELKLGYQHGVICLSFVPLKYLFLHPIMYLLYSKDGSKTKKPFPATTKNLTQWPNWKKRYSQPMHSKCMADIPTQNSHMSWDTDNQEAQRTLRLSALWLSTNSCLSLPSILPHTSLFFLLPA